MLPPGSQPGGKDWEVMLYSPKGAVPLWKYGMKTIWEIGTLPRQCAAVSSRLPFLLLMTLAVQNGCGTRTPNERTNRPPMAAEVGRRAPGANTAGAITRT